MWSSWKSFYRSYLMMFQQMWHAKCGSNIMGSFLSTDWLFMRNEQFFSASWIGWREPVHYLHLLTWFMESRFISVGDFSNSSCMTCLWSLKFMKTMPWQDLSVQYVQLEKLPICSNYDVRDTELPPGVLSRKMPDWC